MATVDGLGSVFFVGIEHGMVRDFGEHESHPIVGDPQRGHLDCHNQDDHVEQADHVEEPTRDLFGHDHRYVVVMRIPAAFGVPILEGTDDVGPVRGPSCNSTLYRVDVSGVGQQPVQASPVGLATLFHIPDGYT